MKLNRRNGERAKRRFWDEEILEGEAEVELRTRRSGERTCEGASRRIGGLYPIRFVIVKSLVTKTPQLCMAVSLEQLYVRGKKYDFKRQT